MMRFSALAGLAAVANGQIMADSRTPASPAETEGTYTIPAGYNYEGAGYCRTSDNLYFEQYYSRDQVVTVSLDECFGTCNAVEACAGFEFHSRDTQGAASGTCWIIAPYSAYSELQAVYPTGAYHSDAADGNARSNAAFVSAENPIDHCFWPMSEAPETTCAEQTLSSGDTSGFWRASCFSKFSDADCAGTWSCSATCEAAADRTFTETTAQAGTGAACPTAVDADCTDGEGDCVIADCAGTWNACTAACEASADRPDFTEVTAQAGLGAACPTAAPDCADGDGECVITDCAGSFSACTSACEAAADRTWTETAAAAGTGAACPAATDCANGDDECVIADCAGTWSACTTACEAAADRTWTETTAAAGGGAACPDAAACAPGDDACPAPTPPPAPTDASAASMTTVTLAAAVIAAAIALY